MPKTDKQIRKEKRKKSNERQERRYIYLYIYIHIYIYIYRFIYICNKYRELRKNDGDKTENVTHFDIAPRSTVDFGDDEEGVDNEVFICLCICLCICT
jgi:hypothetical protein